MHSKRKIWSKLYAHGQISAFGRTNLSVIFKDEILKSHSRSALADKCFQSILMIGNINSELQLNEMLSLKK